MQLSTAVWHILQGKPIIDHDLRRAVVDALRVNPNYLKPIFKAALDDYDEKLSDSLEKKSVKYREEVKISPNKSGNISPKFIMLHHSAGSFLGSMSWILNDRSDVSYHYLINPDDGSRIQHVWDNQKAWHAGKSNYGGYSGLNSHSIGISFSGNTHKREVEDHEIDSCARKCIYLMDKFNIPKSNIITHAMASPGRKDDCSEEVYDRVLSRIKDLS